MHVALFSPAWPLEKFHNGVITYVHWMRAELERLGHRVSVFSGCIDASVDDPRVHLVNHGWFGQALRRVAPPLFPLERDIRGWGRLISDVVLAVHRRDPIDVIEMEESFGWSGDVEAMTGIPVLVKLHGPAFLSLIDEELAAPAGVERVRREGFALARATAIAAPASSTLAQTLAHYELHPKIQAHVVNPLTMDDATPQWRLATSDPKTILFVGRFDKRKGGDVVLRAFELLLRTRPDLTLIFVGPDEGLLQADGRRVHFAEFRDSLFPPPLRDRVDYRGRMANAEIGALRVRARATVIASRWENQGYAALEAMFQGCPVVASDVGGNPESVIHCRTGLLARSEDPADFAARLATMLDDPEAAAAMGAAARRHVIEHHASAKVAQDSLALYQRLISTQPS